MTTRRSKRKLISGSLLVHPPQRVAPDPSLYLGPECAKGTPPPIVPLRCATDAIVASRESGEQQVSPGRSAFFVSAQPPPSSEPARAELNRQIETIERSGGGTPGRDSIVIFVEPARRANGQIRPGIYAATLEGYREPIVTSSQPFLDAARALLARDYTADARLVMRWKNHAADALSAPLGVAARLAVREEPVGFVKFRQFPAALRTR